MDTCPELASVDTPREAATETCLRSLLRAVCVDVPVL